MSIDLSSLFQPTPYPVNPIAQVLQIAYQARESRRRRTEEEAEKKRREELYGLQLGSAKREAQQAEEQARVDAMPAGQFASAQGLRVTPGLETKTIGELRRAHLLATAFERVDPRAEAQQRISGSEMLAKTFGIPAPVYGEDIRTATGYQGPLPSIQARPSIAPAPGQGLASTPLEEGVMLGAREERMVEVPGLGRMPASEAVKIVGTEGLRRITGVEPAAEKPKLIPVTINGKTFNVTESQAAQLAAQMQRDRPGQMVTIKDPGSGQTVTIPATSLPSFFPPRRAPGEGGTTETLSRQTLALRNKYLSGQKLTPQEERLLFGTQGKEIIPARDRAILQQYRANWNTLTNEPIDPQLHEQLKPAATRIIQQLMASPGAAPVPAPVQPIPPRGQTPTPTSPTGPTKPQIRTQPALTGQKTITLAEIQEIARRRGVHPNLIIQEANKQGYIVK